jgi:hypothetical protein
MSAMNVNVGIRGITNFNAKYCKEKDNLPGTPTVAEAINVQAFWLVAIGEKLPEAV